MNTRQLRHFLAVLEHRTLHAAAEAVHLSQPALSRSLRALEDELRVPLFDRQERRLRPTPFALAYAERARRMVQEEREGTREMALMRAGELGSVALGMGSSIAQGLLAPMVLRLQQELPGLRVHALVQSSDVLLAALRAEQLDFFVGDVRVAQGDPALAVQPLYDCRFGWYARAGHPLAGQPHLAIEALRPYPWVGAGYADAAIERGMARLYGLAPPLAQHFHFNTNDVHAVLSVLAGSDAITPATDVTMLAAVQAGQVLALAVEPPPSSLLELPLGLVQRAGATRVPALERVQALVRAYFEAVALSPAPRTAP